MITRTRGSKSGATVTCPIHGTAMNEILVRQATACDLPLTIYYHHDGLGSTIALTDSNGALLESYTYDVYGQPSILSATYQLLPTSSVTNRFLFTGREYLAELALYDYRHRFYSPSLGRFLQTDPLRFDAEDVNLYRYVGNNPLSLGDPLGLKKCFSKEVYDACFNPKKKLADDVLHAAKTWRVYQYKVATKGEVRCKKLCDLGPDWLKPLCYWDCAQIRAAAEALADIQYAADKKTYDLAVAAAISYCTVKATYDVPDGCPCDK